MHEKVLSILTGFLTGGITTILTDKIIDVLFMSFIGGVVGWFGGKTAKWIDKKCDGLFCKKQKQHGSKTN